MIIFYEKGCPSATSMCGIGVWWWIYFLLVYFQKFTSNQRIIKVESDDDDEREQRNRMGKNVNLSRAVSVEFVNDMKHTYTHNLSLSCV